MTPSDIRKKIDNIDKLQFDNEAAHSEEDELYHDFIEFVANETDEVTPKIKGMAKAVLKTKRIKFARYCA